MLGIFRTVGNLLGVSRTPPPVLDKHHFLTELKRISHLPRKDRPPYKGLLTEDLLEKYKGRKSEVINWLSEVVNNSNEEACYQISAILAIERADSQNQHINLKPFTTSEDELISNMALTCITCCIEHKMEREFLNIDISNVADERKYIVDKYIDKYGVDFIAHTLAELALNSSDKVKIRALHSLRELLDDQRALTFLLKAAKRNLIVSPTFNID